MNDTHTVMRLAHHALGLFWDRNASGRMPADYASVAQITEVQTALRALEAALPELRTREQQFSIETQAIIDYLHTHGERSNMYWDYGKPSMVRLVGWRPVLHGYTHSGRVVVAENEDVYGINGPSDLARITIVTASHPAT